MKRILFVGCLCWMAVQALAQDSTGYRRIIGGSGTFDWDRNGVDLGLDDPLVEQELSLYFSPYYLRQVSDRWAVGGGARYWLFRRVDYALDEQNVPFWQRRNIHRTMARFLLRYDLWRKGRMQLFLQSAIRLELNLTARRTEMEPRSEVFAYDWGVRNTFYPGAAFRLIDRIWLVTYVGNLYVDVGQSRSQLQEAWASLDTRLGAGIGLGTITLSVEYRW